MDDALKSAETNSRQHFPDARPLISLVEGLLAATGGTLFEGYTRAAPETWRISTSRGGGGD